MKLEKMIHKLKAMVQWLAEDIDASANEYTMYGMANRFSF